MGEAVDFLDSLERQRFLSDEEKYERAVEYARACEKESSALRVCAEAAEAELGRQTDYETTLHRQLDEAGDKLRAAEARVTDLEEVVEAANRHADRWRQHSFELAAERDAILSTFAGQYVCYGCGAAPTDSTWKWANWLSDNYAGAHLTSGEPCGPVIHKAEAERDRLDSIARFLFDLIDDIDTVADMVKGDREAYYKHVDALQKRRFEVGETDGYTLTWKDVPTTDYKAERDRLRELVREVLACEHHIDDGETWAEVTDDLLARLREAVEKNDER